MFKLDYSNNKSIGSDRIVRRRHFILFIDLIKSKKSNIKRSLIVTLLFILTQK